MSQRDSRASRRGEVPGATPPAQGEEPVGEGGIPAHLRRFIERHFLSGAHVEVLLLLKAVSDRGWTAAEVSRELRIDTDQAARILSGFLRSGFVRGLNDHYRYSPRTATVGAHVEALARLYPAYRLAVISVIYAQPTAPLRDFSDAFNLRAPNQR
ncbi:MAG: hypothetical protein M3357_01095 [Actinomycetota bacterium]|nr:hypothetical protein [Actinomycetota bacterium]